MSSQSSKDLAGSSSATVDEHVAVLAKAIKPKNGPRKDIDFTIHTLETGEKVSTIERISKGNNV